MSRRNPPKRKAKVESDSESEYEYEEKQNNTSEDEVSDALNEKGSESDYDEENESKPAAAPESLVPLSKKKRRRKKEFIVDEEEEALPTYTRKTERGGYSHTNLSKSRISKANSGNKPWNYGRKRSSADRAKIAAGVRARNRTALLQKLKRLGMTEEEYMIKRKEIKYLRERVRRAKLANGKHMDRKKLGLKLQEALDATNDKKNNVVEQEEEIERDEEGQTQEEEQTQAKECIEEENERTTGIFSKEITWRPFSDSEKDYTYDQSCPVGGPGGLICCESCSTKFNIYLTRTSEDVETQRMNKEAGEVTEILEFLNQRKDVLKEAVNSAKTKIPPLPPPGSGRLQLREPVAAPRLNTAGGNRRSGITNKSDKPEIDIYSWNLTSSIDIGFTGGFASV